MQIDTIDKLVKKLLAPPLAKEGFEEIPLDREDQWLFLKMKDEIGYQVFLKLGRVAPKM
ncbi:MAG: hypothetical protein FWE41_04605 [Coriobacteriia bacterium]|nr:hypothetical protein [Coriobacteriia bacterium]MCL2750771.1 hypothetical protein [Coriobacteriia bacterium]